MPKTILNQSVVLLTGASGLVGGTMLRILRSAGARPFTVGRASDSDLRVDLSEEGAYQALVEAPRVDAVIHAAAAVPKNKSNDTAVLGDTTRAIDHCIARFVQTRNVRCCYISGTSIYLHRDDNYIDESSSLYSSHSYYIDAKKHGDLEFCQIRNTSVLRISTPIGRQIHKESMLGKFICAARSLGHIEVWGTGRREQDFVLVDDIARFAVTCLAHGNHGPYNVAHGKPSTALEVAKLVASASGAEIHLGRKEDPNEALCARYSIERARSEGFRSNLNLYDAIKYLVDNWA